MEEFIFLAMLIDWLRAKLELALFKAKFELVLLRWLTELAGLRGFLEVGGTGRVLTFKLLLRLFSSLNFLFVSTTVSKLFSLLVFALSANREATYNISLIITEQI